MKKQLVRITEQDLYRLIDESVNRILENRKMLVSERIKGEKGMSDDEVASDRIRRHRATQKVHKPSLKDSLFKEAVRKSLNKFIKEEMDGQYHGVNDEWYQEEDYDGHVGSEGMIRSYDIGGYYMSNAENDAKESGFNDVVEYLKYWFNEIKQECPWYWTKIGNGYGYHGNTLFREGGVVCKEIADQIMFDEYPIGQAEYDEDFNNRLNRGEFYAN